MRYLIILLGMIIAISSVYAVDSLTLAYKEIIPDPIGVGSVVIPRDKLLIRAAPPGGLLGLKGKLVGFAFPTEQFVVLEEKDIRGVGGVQKWIKVSSQRSKDGWIFSGFANKEPSRNFSLVDVQLRWFGIL